MTAMKSTFRNTLSDLILAQQVPPAISVTSRESLVAQYPPGREPVSLLSQMVAPKIGTTGKLKCVFPM